MTTEEYRKFKKRQYMAKWRKDNPLKYQYDYLKRFGMWKGQPFNYTFEEFESIKGGEVNTKTIK